MIKKTGNVCALVNIIAYMKCERPPALSNLFLAFRHISLWDLVQEVH